MSSEQLANIYIFCLAYLLAVPCIAVVWLIIEGGPALFFAKFAYIFSKVY